MSDCIVSEISDSDFESKVLQDSGLVLVDFWAPWCGPCVAFAPQLEKIAHKYSGRLKVFKLNVQDHQDTPLKYGISAIPTVLLFNNGKEISRIVGVDLQKTMSAIDSALSS